MKTRFPQPAAADGSAEVADEAALPEVRAAAAQVRRPLVTRAGLLRIHRWASLGALVWILVLSVTGTILVFGSQLEEWSRTELYRSTPGDRGPQAAVDAALARFEGRDSAVDHIGLPGDNRGVYLLYVGVADATPGEPTAPGGVADGGERATRSHLVYVDPGTAQVNGSRREASGFLYWVKRGHFALWQDDGFAGVDGDDLAGLVALATVWITLSGFVVWYLPRLRPWFRALRNLRVRARRGAYVFSVDLHRTLGMAVLVPLTVIAFTGAAFSFPDMKLVWERLTPAQHDYVQNEPEEDLVSEEPGDAPALTTDSVTALLRDRYPTLDLESLEPPASSDGVWGAWLTKGYSPWQRDGSGGNVYVNVDRFSQEVIYAGTPADGNVFDQAWEDWSLPLHTGDFLGNASRGVWFAVGLSPLVLSATGVVVWWNRRARFLRATKDQ